MKKISNISRYSLTALIVTALIAPASLLAQSATSTPNGGKDFCDRLPTISTNVQKRITHREGQFRDQKDNRLEKFLGHATSTDERLRDSRERADANRKEHYDRLLERATTDAQKQAVAEFRATMDAAIAKRRAAIDVAVKTFHADVRSMISSRAQGLEKAAMSFRTGEAAAFQAAKDACAQNKDLKSIRHAFNLKLHDLQRSFEADRAKANRLGVGVDGLARKRQEAFSKARAEFQETSQKALEKLHAAF